MPFSFLTTGSGLAGFHYLGFSDREKALGRIQLCRYAILGGRLCPPPIGKTCTIKLSSNRTRTRFSNGCKFTNTEWKKPGGSVQKNAKKLTCAEGSLRSRGTKGCVAN